MAIAPAPVAICEPLAAYLDLWPSTPGVLALIGARRDAPAPAFAGPALIEDSDRPNGVAGIGGSDRMIGWNRFEAEQERRHLPDTDSADATKRLHQGVRGAAMAIQRQ